MTQVTPSRPPLSVLEHILQDKWGYPAFRPSQVPVVLSAVSGGDTLAILPTGGGKSICYQVPGLFRGGVCLVISPLIALMKDQVDGLQRQGITAAALTSGMRKEDVFRVLDNFKFGPGGFLFAAPERLVQPDFEVACKAMDVQTIAIDEAHCVSQWGHAFRADYLTLARLRSWHPSAAWIALTATATEQVADDIERLLDLNDATRIRASMRRSNLKFSVQQVQDRHEAIIDWASRLSGSAILYVRTRRDAESMSAMLKAHGFKSGAYHAGMRREDREDRQKRWLSDDIQVLACTTAFGMGIDKPDVRHVAHAHAPDSPEGYIQEAGRAGRDGRLAHADLFLDASTLEEAERNVLRQWPTHNDVRSVLQAVSNRLSLAVGSLMEDFEELDVRPLAQKSGCTTSTLRKCLDLMARAGWIEFGTVRPHISGQWLRPVAELVQDVEMYEAEQRSLAWLLQRYSHSGRNPWRLDLEAFHAGMGCDASTAAQHLKLLQEKGALVISHPKDRISLRFILARPDARTARIPAEILDHRKKDALKRWERMKGYIETSGCRAQYLEMLFDPVLDPACGICDRCHPPLPPDERWLQRHLESGIPTLELQRLVPPVHRDSVRAILEQWRAEGKLSWEGGRFSWRQGGC